MAEVLQVHLAANNGDLGGGEVMLLRTADALRDLGHRPVVVAPTAPAEVLDAATGSGHPTVAVRAVDRRRYARRLRAWDRAERHGLLWCHGLLPSAATAGRRGRVVHLHQEPAGAAQRIALRAARRGALAVLVPSQDMAGRVPGAVALPNWTGPVAPVGRPDPDHVTVGFLGRLSTDKGLDVLARALAEVEEVDGRPVRLVVAGDSRWVPEGQRQRVDDALAGLDGRVRLLGHVPREEFFGRVDVAVFPSTWAEPFGLVVAEAMSAEVPFVVSDAGALPEVAGRDHPWVVPAGDAARLAEAVRQAVAANGDGVDAARDRWAREYGPDAGRERVRTVLSGLGVG